MQSGKDRGVFKVKEGHKHHTKEVTGLGLDSLNKYLVSSSLDGTLKLWDFFRC